MNVGKVADTRASEERGDIFSWVLERMLAIDRVFRPRIKGMVDGPAGEGDTVD